MEGCYFLGFSWFDGGVCVAFVVYFWGHFSFFSVDSLFGQASILISLLLRLLILLICCAMPFKDQRLIFFNDDTIFQ